MEEAEPTAPGEPVSPVPSHLRQLVQPGNADQGRDSFEKSLATGEGKSGRLNFGWVTFGETHIPYIFRDGEKYCSVRILEMKLLNKYVSVLHCDVYSCIRIGSCNITNLEARLLNEINVKHCVGQFGQEAFTDKDLIMRLQDAEEFYNFLDICYNKLVYSSSGKCGFVRINGALVVAYIVRDSYKYVPLFYFEREIDHLKPMAEKLEGWDLAYLKFCLQVQGTHSVLHTSETCSVISLNYIKTYLPAGTIFEDYWPSEDVYAHLLLPSSNV